MPSFFGSSSGGGSRADMQNRRRGIIAETIPMGTLGAAAMTISSGRVVYGLVGAQAGDTMTGVGTILAASAVGSSSLYIGVVDKNLNRLTISTNLTTGLEVALAGGGRIELALAYTFPYTDAFYLAMFWAGVTTAPQIRRGAASDQGIEDQWNTTGLRAAAIQDGQTTIPTTASLTATTAGVPYLVALGTQAA